MIEHVIVYGDKGVPLAVGFGLDRTFEKMDVLNALEAKVDGHLKKNVSA